MATLEDQLKTRLKTLERITQETNRQKELTGQILSDTQKEAAVSADKIKDLRQLSDLLKGTINEQNVALSVQIDRLNRISRSSRGITEAQQNQLDLYTQIRNTVDLTTRQELAEQAQQLARIEEHLQRSLSLAKQYQSSWAQALGFSTRGYETLIGSIVRGSQELGSFTEAIKVQARALAQEGAQIWTPMNVLNTVLENTRDFAIALDASTSEFVSATGASRSYGAQIQAVALDTTAFGADVRAVGQAYAGLYTSFTSFSQLSIEQQKLLGRTGALLQKVGIDARTFGQSMDSLTKGLQMSLGQAEATIRGFAESAAQLGMAPATLANNFVQLMPQLAAFGSQAPAVFLRASQAAKALGLEMREMLRVTSAFDEFDRAAEAVGGLNAILGGTYLDTVSMVLTTDPTERIIMMKQAFDAAGQSVQTMEYFQLKALSTQAGFGENVDAFRRAMSQSTTELRRQNVETQRLQQLAADATNVMEKIRQSFYRFMIQMDPVINMVRGVIDSFMELTKTPVVGTLIKIVGTFGLVTAGMVKMISMAYAMKAGLGVLATTAGLLGSNLVVAGLAFSAVWSAMSRFKGISASVAKGIVAIAIAVGLLRAVQSAGASVLTTAAGVAAMAGLGATMTSMVQHAREGAEPHETKGQPYIVGEGGEEMVVPPPGSAILTNDNTGKLLAATEKRGGAQLGEAGSSELVAALDRNTAARQTELAAKPGSPAGRGPARIELNIDGRKFADVMMEHLYDQSGLPV